MLKISNFEDLKDISQILTSVLEIPADMPSEVTEAVRAAKKQLEGLPFIIADLNLAYERFRVLAATLGRMSDLARASEKETMIASEREDFNAEFRNLAKVIANEAGQKHFQGTSLTLESPSGAKAARKVLSYLDPVIKNLGEDLKGQKSLIIEALAETLNFMGIITRCYPGVPGIEALKNTLEKIQIPQNIDDPVKISPTLH
jgi:hypothetical protein